MDALAGIGTLALFRPSIPVVDQANKGGLGVLELRKDPPEPVVVTAPIALGMQPNTTLVLYWDNRVVDSYKISQEQLGTGLIVFRVPPHLILDNDNAVLYYTSASPIGGNPDTSPTRTVIVNTRVPGNPPLNPIEPVNANLEPPRNIPNPVTDANSANGITVTILNWVNMEVGDILTLTWGQTRIPFGRPLVQSDLDRPLTIHVSQATVLANSNMLGLKVFYDIRDIVGNWSLNSRAFVTDIEAGSNIMPAPRINEADANGDIDLARLGAGNVHVVVPVYSPWTAQDHVAIRWHGLTAGGSSVDETVEFDMTPGDEGFPVTKEIQNPTVTAIAGGTAVVYYEVNNVRRSRRRSLTVSGTVPPLAKPQVLEAQNGVLDPAILPGTGATVVVPQYAGMDKDDKIYLYWEGTTEAGDATHYSAEHTVGTIGFVQFSVPTAANVTPLAGGSVKIYYTVVVGLVSRTSDTLQLSVSRNQPVELTEAFDMVGNNIIRAGNSIRPPHTLISFASGAGTAGVNDVYDPVSQGGDPALFQRPALQVCIADVGVQTILIDLLQTWDRVTINVLGAVHGRTTLEFRDELDRFLYGTTPPSGSPRNQTLQYSANGGTPIRYLRIFGQQNWTVWDNIKMIR